jgi:hypothetical protein
MDFKDSPSRNWGTEKSTAELILSLVSHRRLAMSAAAQPSIKLVGFNNFKRNNPKTDYFVVWFRLLTSVHLAPSCC